MNKQIISLLLLSTTSLVSYAGVGVGVYAAQLHAKQPFSACRHNFYNKSVPVYQGRFQSLNKGSYDLCFNGFAVNYSGVSKTPLWSAEYLNIARLRQASEIDREDSFHIEERVAIEHAATLNDYSKSGFDRGHLAPNADMATKLEQHDSFSLANITPQNPELNRNLWRDVEYVTRGLVYKYNEVWVVTGVAFNSQKLQRLNNNVLVPSHQFKAVYIPSQGIAGAYYAPNNDSQIVEVINLNDLKSRIGLDAFPSVSYQIKAQAPLLPFPNHSDFKSRSHKDKSNSNQQYDSADENDNNEPIISEESKSFLFKIIAVIKKILSILG